MKFKPGDLVRAIKPFRVGMFYKGNGLCGVGEFFMVGADSCDEEVELWVVEDLLHADARGQYRMPARTYKDPKQLEGYVEVVRAPAEAATS
jgi:hypothetical protein